MDSVEEEGIVLTNEYMLREFPLDKTYIDLSERNIIRMEENAFKGFEKIEFLYLSNNKIQNIEALKILCNLKVLFIRDNTIEDISPLRYLTELDHLDLSNNRIEDVSAIEKLHYLYMLNLSNNKIKDVNCLKDLTLLRVLYLSSNLIEEVNILENLYNLKNVDLNNNRIKMIDEKSILTLEGLKSFSMSYNPYELKDETKEKLLVITEKNISLMDNILMDIAEIRMRTDFVEMSIKMKKSDIIQIMDKHTSISYKS